MRGSLLVFLIGSMAFAGAGCAATVGSDCDEDRARTPVYDSGGNPAYPGQALINGACTQCHAEGLRMRRGAPAGLDFNLTLVTATDAATAEEQARLLLRTQGIVHRHRDLIYGQVAGGAMPPPDTVAIEISGFEYEDGTALPGLASAEGQEELRNWLACGSPLVERTAVSPMPCSTNADCNVTRFCDTSMGQCVGVGDVVASRGVAIDPQWSTIHPFIITTCATAGCHDATSRQSGLDLSDRAMAYTALTSTAPGAMSISCGGSTANYVVPGMPDESLFLSKVESDTPLCGSRMPFGMPLSETQLTAIRQWIMMGAMND